MKGCIYSSITANIDATVENGQLFVRKRKPMGSWEPIDVSADDALANWLEAERAEDSNACFYWGCIRHCLKGAEDSKWRVEPVSERISREIADLFRQLEIAKQREEADRPGVAV